MFETIMMNFSLNDVTEVRYDNCTCASFYKAL